MERRCRCLRRHLQDIEWLEEHGLPVGESMEDLVRQVAEAMAKAEEPPPMVPSPYDISGPGTR